MRGRYAGSTPFDNQFLAGNAVPAPGNGIQAVESDLLLAVHAGSKRAIAEARKGAFHQDQQPALLRFLQEGHFFRLREIRAIALIASKVVGLVPLVGVLAAPQVITLLREDRFKFC